MAAPTAEQVLERHYLEARSKLLELAATFDRIARAEGADSLTGDPRLDRLRQAVQLLSAEGDDRAERIQMLFSDAYEAGWNQ